MGNIKYLLCKECNDKNTVNVSESAELTGCKDALERIEVAEQHVFDLCSGKARWTMSVPVEENRDSDCVIIGALTAARKIIESL